MPEKCVVFGCSAMPKGGTASWHHFPKDTHVRQAWIRFVQRTRKWDGPTETSTVCSQHFMSADFENLQRYKMGFVKSLRPAARKRELHRVRHTY